MSSMLEQAIVDAKALKESAIKNAEAMVIEKYSDQIKEAVDSLLEQDEALEEDFESESAETEANPVLDQVPTTMEEDLPANAGGGDVTDSTTLTLDLPDLLQKMEEIEKEEGAPAADVLDADKESHEELAQDMAPAVDSAPEAASTMMEDIDLEEDSITDALVEK